MKIRIINKIIALFLLTSFSTLATGQTTDTIDILHYDLGVDIDHLKANEIVGCATLTIRMVRTSPQISLDLKRATVDSVKINGMTDTTYEYNTLHLTLHTGQFSAGDTFSTTIFYHTQGYVESPSGWGGFHMDNNIHYNLGVSFNEYPHCFGRTWFPCRDNFQDKATYRISVTTKAGWSAICGGIQDSCWTNDDNSNSSSWTLSHPTPTYLVSVAVAPFRTIERTYTGLYDSYPAILGFTTHDSTRVQQAFDNLELVLPMFEQCFGPYHWNRIGYIATQRGSMEHVNNIALASSFMASTDLDAQSVIAHEFSHSWFGNLVTCATSEDMWINEGGATFCEEIAMQAIFPGPFYKEYYETNLEEVLRACHRSDNGYRAVYGLPHDLTYGSTTYDKGALVWHTIRGYLGDSLFYSTMRTFFENNAWGNIDSYGLRDTLATISNTSLDDLFDFYVFSPGFVDYLIDSISTQGTKTTVFIHQKTIGVDTIVKNDRIPITFFSSEGDTATRHFALYTRQGSYTFQIPFEAKYAIVNYDKQIATAATSGYAQLNSTGAYAMPLAHFSTNVRQVNDTAHSHLNVTHHWSAPDASQDCGIVRLSHRFWHIDGNLKNGTKLNGHFDYCCGTYTNGSYPYLDKGFYDMLTSFDSLKLVYREDCTQPWRVISSTCEGNASQGTFSIFNLKLGEYALAIIDTARLSINDPDYGHGHSVKIYPNPSNGMVLIELAEGISSGKFDIINSIGQIIVNDRSINDSATITLPSGSYVFRIKDGNNKIIDSRAVTIQ